MSAIEGLVLTFALNGLWQGALIVLSAQVLDMAMRRFPARHRHLIWVSALALMLLLPIASLRARVLEERTERAKSEALEVGRDVLCTGEEELAPESASPLAMLAALVPPGQAQPGSLMGIRHIGILLPAPVRTGGAIVVLLLFAVGCVRIVRAWWAARSLRLSARPHPPSDALAKALARCRHAFDASEGRPGFVEGRHVLLLESAHVPGPVTLGIVRPVIILPMGFAEGASAEHLTAALGHELAHIRRRDYALNLLCEILMLPLAFHPLVPALKRRIGRTREIACDEMVAAHLLDRRRCARALLGLARSITSASGPAHALGVLDAGILEERIMRLIDTTRRPGAPTARLVLAAACALLVGIGTVASSLSLGIAVPSQAPSPTAVKTVDPKMLGTWELFVTRDGQDPQEELARHPFTLWLTIDRGILAGKVSIPVLLASKEGTVFKEPVFRPLLAPRFDGRTFGFMIDNGEEYLIGEMTRAGEHFVGRWTSSLSGQEGSLKMLRKE